MNKSFQLKQVTTYGRTRTITRRQEILAQLSRGEINVQEATRLLSQVKGDRS